MTSSRYSKPAPAMRLHTFRFDLRHGMYRKITVHERALEDSSVLLAMASLPEDHHFSEELFNSLQPIYEYLKTAEWHFQSPTTLGRLTELTKAYCMAIELDFQRLPNVLLRLGKGLKVEKEPDALFETAQVVYSKLTKAGDPYRAFFKSAAKKCFRESRPSMADLTKLTQKGGYLAVDTRAAHRDALKELKGHVERMEASRTG
jgi:hypothetical protein